MSTNRLFSALLTTIAIVAASGVADAHSRWGRYSGRYHSYPSFGFYFGAPLYRRRYYPYYYPYYPYYRPEIVTVPVEPPVYIERGAHPRSAQQLSPGYWYYCNDPEGYYPYVKECKSAWLQVNPVPSSPR